MCNVQLIIRRYITGLVLIFLPLLAWGKIYSPKDVPDPKKDGQWEYVSNPDGILNGEDVAYLNNTEYRGARYV